MWSTDGQTDKPTDQPTKLFEESDKIQNIAKKKKRERTFFVNSKQPYIQPPTPHDCQLALSSENTY
jgi:hypothetical protein